MRMLKLLPLIALLPALALAQEKQAIQAPGGITGLPFSTAVRVGNTIYLSGQIGTKPGTRELAPGGTAAEVRQILENIKATLEYAGSSMDRVAKCTVFLKDIADYTAMNQVYASFFPKDPPARSTVAVSGLAFNASAEIECIAVAGK